MENTKTTNSDGGLIGNVIFFYLMVTGTINVFTDYGFWAAAGSVFVFPVAMLFGVPDFIMLMINIFDAVVN